MYLILITLIAVLIPYLLHENEEIVIETARSFGNFSRNKDVRNLMMEKKGALIAVINIQPKKA